MAVSASSASSLNACLMRSLPQYRQPDPFETFAYRGSLSRPHRSHLHGHGRAAPG